MVWIIVMFWSSVWTLILTAPIHCRASTAEQVMEGCISPNLKQQQTHLRWPETVWLNYSFKRISPKEWKLSLFTDWFMYHILFLWLIFSPLSVHVVVTTVSDSHKPESGKLNMSQTYIQRGVKRNAFNMQHNKLKDLSLLLQLNNHTFCAYITCNNFQVLGLLVVYFTCYIIS